MSKQLAISSAFSVFAMAAFALFAVPDAGLAPGPTTAGAKTFASAPALEQQQLSLPRWFN